MGTVFEGLNPEQHEFVYSNAKVILALAGPGSGKTRCLTYRVARLINEGIPPRRIMLTTFTKKAADEIRERLEPLVKGPVRQLTSGTFHSLGSRFIRRYHKYLGLDDNYKTLNDRESQSLLEDVAKRIGFLRTADRATKEYFNRDRIRTIVGLAANTGVGFDELLAQRFPLYESASDEFVRLHTEYTSLKRAMNACDFDDLLVLWLELLKNHEDVREEARGFFDHILIDEFQDTNIVQSEIVKLMADGPSLAVVGDADQSIYKFRGAEVQNMITFTDTYPDAQVIRLTWNYRCTPEILRVSNALIKHNEDRFEMDLRTPNPPGELPIWYESDNAIEEAYWLANTLKALHTNHPDETVAVLYRSSFLAGLLEFELLENGTPYEVYGGRSVLRRNHIHDVLAWLRAFVDKNDAYAWRKVLFFYKEDTDDVYLDLWNQIRDSEDPVLEILSNKIRPRQRNKEWDALKKTLGRMMVSGYQPGRMIRSLLIPEYVERLEQRFDDGEERAIDIERFADYADRFRGVMDFVKHVEDESKKDETTSGIALSTMHSSKGKEFDWVFILGCNETYTPSTRAVEANEVNEERRLFYVACTRAKKRLHFMSCLEATSGDNKVGLEPSRFLLEMPEDAMRIICLEPMKKRNENNDATK